MDSRWIEWTQRLQAIAQSGLTFAHDPYDVERYRQIQELAAEMAAGGREAAFPDLLRIFRGEKGYGTPKVDVRGVVFREDAILLVKEREDGLWTLPGGWADVGMSPSEAVVREVQEEAGFLVRPVKLLALLDRNKHDYPPHLFHIYKVFIACGVIAGTVRSELETEEVGFFRENEIPPLSRTRVMPEQISRVFEHHRHPEWPTDFD